MRLLNKLLLLVIIISPFELSAQNDKFFKESEKLSRVLYYIHNYYKDTINIRNFTDEAITNIVSQLDPHSVFIKASEVKAMNEPLEGSFDGIGVQYAVIKDTLTIELPISGGPSERVGIRSGDKIIKINDEIITGIAITTAGVSKRLRGPKGTKVNVTIVRKGVTSPIEFTITRDKIPINSLDASYEVEPGIFYIKLGRFAVTSAQEIKSVLQPFNPSYIKGIILDLRGNSGGLLGSAIDISDMFLEKGKKIVSTEGTHVPTNIEYATGNGLYTKTKIAILIDEYSASSSEILAGAIQDWDRGAIIGRVSFGKGLVQQMLPLNDGSQLRLTIAQYHTPSGRVIQRSYNEGKRDEYYSEMSKRIQNGESFTPPKPSSNNKLIFRTLVRGREVYGGGGITPDIFVPADTSSNSPFLRTILNKGILVEFANQYIDNNRIALLKKYKNFKEFDLNFLANTDILNCLIAYSKEKDIKPNSDDLTKSKNRINLYLKALVARTLFGSSEYFKILNEENDIEYIKAIAYIKGNIAIF